MTIQEPSMTQTVREAELGRLSTPRRAPTDDVRHRLLFVAPLDAVVMPFSRVSGGGWLCLVVAARDSGQNRPRHLVLTEDQLAAASARLVLDVDDHDGLALLLWPARVFLRWPGGAFPILARVLAEEVRVPGTLHLPVQAVADHGRLAARLPNARPPAVARMLDRLHRAGFLDPDPTGGHTLTLPEPPAGQAATSAASPR
jgi:hypothetical protein